MVSNLLVRVRAGSVMEGVAASTLPNHFISEVQEQRFLPL